MGIKRVVAKDIDDKLVSAIQELDDSVNDIVAIIVEKHPEFVIDFLIGTTYSKDITAGGVRIFSGSRKKEVIKLKLLTLISYIRDKDKFIYYMKDAGLVRGVKEKLVEEFFVKVKENFIGFLQVYKDPFPTYKLIYPRHYNYTLLRRTIVKIAYNVLPKMVLTNYSGWKNKRDFRNSEDFFNYQEDFQNSSFSISKAIRLFDSYKHKSFFAYASFWVKEGISSSEYTLNNKEVTFVPLDSLLRPTEPYNMDEEYDEDSPPEDLDNHTSELIIFEEYFASSNVDSISPLYFIKSAFPLPNELRIFLRILQNL